MKQDKETVYPEVRYRNQAESRLINIQKERMAELEKRLGINATTRKTQKIEIPNNGEPISDEQVEKQRKAIKRMLNIKKLDFILETNKQSELDEAERLGLYN